MKVSDCCFAPCSEWEFGFCPDCKEHCEFVELEEEDFINDVGGQNE